MPSSNDAKSIANLYIEEIFATIEIRKSYNTIVVPMAGPLMGVYKHDEQAKEAIRQALAHKTNAPSMLYKSLIVQIHGVFENFIRSLVTEVIEERLQPVELFPDLEKVIRNNYIAHAARVLTHVKAGDILGVAYNFDGLLANLGTCLSGQKGYKLNPEVYTKLMGNCTADRLSGLFEALSLPEPFSDVLGQQTKLKAHFKDSAKGRVASNAKKKLDEQLALRNDIVHGDLTRATDLNELMDALDFFRALIEGLDQVARIIE
jgi:hypothetical protein